MKDLHEYFNSISPLHNTTWDIIQKIFSELSIEKGAYFTEEGKTSKKIGFLKEGIMRAFYRNSDGIEYNKHFFIEHSMVGGFSSLVSQSPNLINQQALTDCKLLVADYQKITNLFNQHQDLERFARIVAEKYFIEKEKREVELVVLNADKRYDIFLKEYPGLEQLIPQYHIASYLGITPTQLSRIRRKNRKS